jgi:hypothetical protein
MRLSVPFLASALALLSACSDDSDESDGGDTYTDTGTDADTDADTDTDTDADTDTGSDTESDTDSSTQYQEYEWHTFHGSDGNQWGGLRVAVGSDDSIYVAGWSEATWDGPLGESPLNPYTGDVDIHVLKLDSSGQYQWHTFFGDASSDDFARDIVVADDGEIMVVGDSLSNWYGPEEQAPIYPHETGIGGDALVIKLTSAGEYLWHGFFGGTDTWESAYGLVEDSLGDFYVVGDCDGIWNGPLGENPVGDPPWGGAFALKIDSDGEYQWHTILGPSNGDGVAKDVTIGSDGAVYVSGNCETSWGGPSGEPPLLNHNGDDDLFLFELDSNGNYGWHTFFGSFEYEYANGMSSDSNGGLYIVGTSHDTWDGPLGEPPLNGPPGDNFILVLKSDIEGEFHWHSFYGLTQIDIGSDVVVDAADDVFVVGQSDRAWSGPDGETPITPGGEVMCTSIMVLKVDSDGGFLWHAFYGSMDDNKQSNGRGITIDNGGRLLITGASWNDWQGPLGEIPINPFSENTDFHVLSLSY